MNIFDILPLYKPWKFWKISDLHVFRLRGIVIGCHCVIGGMTVGYPVKFVQLCGDQFLFRKSLGHNFSPAAYSKRQLNQFVLVSRVYQGCQQTRSSNIYVFYYFHYQPYKLILKVSDFSFIVFTEIYIYRTFISKLTQLAK